MSRNKRREPRICIEVEVRLLLPGHEPRCVRSGDLSDSGLYLYLPDDLTIEIGTEVAVCLNQTLGDGEPPVLRALVVRSDTRGIGLKFIDGDET